MRNWGAAVWVVILIVAGLLIRVLVQHGSKPLRNAHPWDWILMVVTVVIALWALTVLAKRRAA